MASPPRPAFGTTAKAVAIAVAERIERIFDDLFIFGISEALLY